MPVNMNALLSDLDNIVSVKRPSPGLNMGGLKADLDAASTVRPLAPPQARSLPVEARPTPIAPEYLPERPQPVSLERSAPPPLPRESPWKAGLARPGEAQSPSWIGEALPAAWANVKAVGTEKAALPARWARKLGLLPQEFDGGMTLGRPGVDVLPDMVKEPLESSIQASETANQQADASLRGLTPGQQKTVEGLKIGADLAESLPAYMLTGGAVRAAAPALAAAKGILPRVALGAAEFTGGDAVLNPENTEESALRGAATGGIMGLAGGVAEPFVKRIANPIGQRLARGVVEGGAMTAATGGDIKQGAIAGIMGATMHTPEKARTNAQPVPSDVRPLPRRTAQLTPEAATAGLREPMEVDQNFDVRNYVPRPLPPTPEAPIAPMPVKGKGGTNGKTAKKIEGEISQKEVEPETTAPVAEPVPVAPEEGGGKTSYKDPFNGETREVPSLIDNADIDRFNELRGINTRFNKKGVTKSEKRVLIDRANELRKELSSYDSQYIKDMELGVAQLPQSKGEQTNGVQGQEVGQGQGQVLAQGAEAEPVEAPVVPVEPVPVAESAPVQPAIPRDRASLEAMKYPDLVKIAKQEGAVKPGGKNKKALVDALVSGPVNPEEKFVRSSDQSIDLGSIGQDAAQAIGRPSAPVRLERQSLGHFNQLRLKQIQQQGYSSTEALVEDVARNHTHIYQGREGRESTLILAKRNGKDKIAYIELIPDESGQYYRVNSALVARPNYLNNKPLLWERAQSSQLPRESPSAVAGQSNGSKDIIENLGVEIKTEHPLASGGVVGGETGETADTNDGITLQSTIIPGGKEFVEQDVLPAVKSAGSTVIKAWDSIRKTLAPASRGEKAKATALNLRELGSIKQRALDQIGEAIAPAREYFDKYGGKITDPNSQSYKFIDNLERGNLRGLTTEEQPYGQMVFDIMDDLLHQVQQRGSLEQSRASADKLGDPNADFLTYYFPRLWKDPVKAQSLMMTLLGKRPFEGSKAFLKQRTIELFEDGIAAGLEPAYSNPMDLVFHKAAEMRKWIMAHDWMEGEKNAGQVGPMRIASEERMKFVPIGKKAPDGWIKIDDSMGQVFSRSENGELILRGNYYAPEQSATVFNNLVSKGLRGNDMFRAYLGAANMMNQFQLGLSAFHAGFTTLDVAVSNVSLGLRQLSQGRPLAAIKSFAKAPTSPITNLMSGNKMMREWFKPGSTTPEIAKLVELMQTGGGRARMDNFYQTNMVQKMTQAMRSGNYIGGILRLPGATMELVSKPVLEWLVPRQKAGIIAMLAKDALESNPNMTHAEAQAKMAEIVDSVDNRMGQLIYDNLFWDKRAKDLGMASVRSLGWNLGTWREVGGGIVDTAKEAAGLFKGKKPEMTQRMSYTLALPIVVGTLGAVTQYLLTGKGPEEPKDYFFPKTGKTNEYGDPERVALPSYMKDIAHIAMTRDVKMFTNKLHPLIGMSMDMFFNKDFYGTEIHHPDDNFFQRRGEDFIYALKQMTPFAVQGLKKNLESGQRGASAVLPFIGITPAPAYVNQTPAERLAWEMVAEKRPKGARTKEEFERTRTTRELSRQMRVSNGDAATRKLASDALKNKEITWRQFQSVINDYKKEPIVNAAKSLDYDEIQKIYELADEKEKKLLEPMISKKEISDSKKFTPVVKKTKPFNPEANYQPRIKMPPGVSQ